MRNFASMNIAVIGTGELAERYALKLSDAGHEVYLAWKDGQESGLAPMLETLDGINICSIEEAADVADMIIIATSPIDVREVAYWLGDVRRKVIIDATSNVFAGVEEQVRTVCAIKAITGSQLIVKSFNTKGYEQLLKPIFGAQPAEFIMVGNSKKAKVVLSILAAELGIKTFYDFGGDEAIPLFNALTTSLREQARKTIVKTKPARVIKH
jgi:predicted dinucleotide-binding enzyme